MGVWGSNQGKGRGFGLSGGSLAAISAPRRNWVNSAGAQFRCMPRKAAAASEIEANSTRNGSSQVLRHQNTGSAGAWAA
jgi:hypothetical protein